MYPANWHTLRLGVLYANVPVPAQAKYAAIIW